MARDNKLRVSYRFLHEKQESGEPFIVEEMCEVTGWAESTVKTYLTKKWPQFVVEDDGAYYVQNLGEYDEDEYVRLMSQKQVVSATPRRPDLPPRIEGLVTKAREAALHALDSYNRPSTIFRTEGFIVMMVIAWTALLHAIFEKREIDYFYKNDDGKPKMIDGDTKAWDLSRCITEFFGGAYPPTKANLEFIIGLRNKIVHRFVPAIDPHVAGEAQA